MKFKLLAAVLILTLVTTLVGCRLIKPIARTANDIGLKACKDTFGASDVELPKGMSLEEFCAIHENVQPFIDNILAAKRTVGTAQGVSYKKE